MIPVRLVEQERTFDLRIGRKLVGRVVCFAPNCFRADVLTPGSSPRNYVELDTELSFLKAVNRVTRHLGFGPVRSVAVERQRLHKKRA